MKNRPLVIVIGGGLGGLWTTLRIVEAGFSVELFSLFEVKRSHSVCAQGGINAVLDTKGQRDSVRQHLIDTVKGGSYLANQPPIQSMCEEAPGLIRTFERMGVTFSRTPEGLMDLRLFGGVKNKRTCFAGASTGQQLMYGVDEQVRRHEAQGSVHKREWWEFLSLVLDNNGHCKGIIAFNLHSLEVRAFRADAVVMATGGMGKVYGHRTTNSTNSTGAAAFRCYLQGARFANAEFFQFHPTAMLGDDKTRLMSEAARGEGGRLWVPKRPDDSRDPRSIPENERFYFLEEWYPSYGNTVPRDVASRAIWKIVREQGQGVGGADKVYLDLTHLDKKFVTARLGAILDIYRKFHGSDPLESPMEIFPSAHYAMGGLWINYEKDEQSGGLKYGSPRNHATNIPGLYACGECDSGYHGANRLGANSLLSASFSGRVTGESVATYLQGLEQSSNETPSRFFAEGVAREQAINEGLLKSNGHENPYRLHDELGALMTGKVGVVRDNPTLDLAYDELLALEQRSRSVGLGDRCGWSNQSLAETRQVQEMIRLSAVITRCARARDECRGAHYKPEFRLTIPEGKFPGDPEFEAYREAWKRKNDKWLKTTLAEHDGDGPRISYEAVDTSIIPPEQPRDYR
ncbi:MAG: succinate dehydrogenase flavoprotein subunit [endosymbiont of Escarpia spicata]|uniref:succinate dehydrogenase n=1 Tax=endosymbiont of Escarpia spicata TaxID=2200908 RepID=A0A370DJI3_9GAMM|nr:MAG: succinate dehydrogenase flavoprotein subunit [endosymbiont of Escarpia spicata]